jgi:hypothetical protein
MAASIPTAWQELDDVTLEEVRALKQLTDAKIAAIRAEDAADTL